MILGRGKPKPLEGEGTFPSIICNVQEGEEQYCVVVLCPLTTLKSAHKRLGPWNRADSEGHCGIDCRALELL